MADKVYRVLVDVEVQGADEAGKAANAVRRLSRATDALTKAQTKAVGVARKVTASQRAVAAAHSRQRKTQSAATAATRAGTAAQQAAAKALQVTEKRSRAAASAQTALSVAHHRAAKAARSQTTGQASLSASLDKSKMMARRLVASLAILVTSYLGVAQAQQAVTSSVQAFVAVEDRLSAVEAVTQATGQQMVWMSGQARELGETTRFSATEAASGMEFLGRAGFEVTEILGAMPSMLDLASAGQLDLGRAADITSNIMSAFNLSASRTVEIADALASSSARSNTSVEQLGEAMKFVGPVASSLGHSVQNTAAAMGVLSDAGLQGSLAGTGLRRVLSELVAPSTAAEEALADMGLRIDELNPKTKSIIEITERLAEANIDAGRAFTIFGDRGAPAILALTSQLPRLRELTETVNDSEGAAASMAATMEDNLGGSFRSMRSALEGFQISIGEGLEPAITSLLKRMALWLRENQAVGRQIGRDLGKTLERVAKIIKVVADNVDIVVAATKLWLALKIAAFINGAAVALQAYTAQMGAAAVATTAQAGATGAATTASKGFIAAGLGPVGIALAVVLAGLLAVNEALEGYIDRMDRAVEAEVLGSAQFSDRLASLNEEITGLVENAGREADSLIAMREGFDAGSVSAEAFNAAVNASQAGLNDLGARIDSLREAQDDHAAATAEQQFQTEALGRKYRDYSATLREGNPRIAEAAEAHRLATIRLNEMRREGGETEAHINRLVGAYAAWAMAAETVEETHKAVARELTDLENDIVHTQQLLDWMERFGVSSDKAARALEQVLDKDNDLSATAIADLVDELFALEAQVDAVDAAMERIVEKMAELQAMVASNRLVLPDIPVEPGAALDVDDAAFLPSDDDLERMRTLNRGLDDLRRSLGLSRTEAEARRDIEDDINEMIRQGVLAEHDREEAIRLSLKASGLLEGSIERQILLTQRYAEEVAGLASGLSALGSAVGGSTGGQLGQLGSIAGGIGQTVGAAGSLAGATTALGALGGVFGLYAAFFAVGIEILDFINKDVQKSAGHIQAAQGRAISTMQGSFGEIGALVDDFGTEIASSINAVADRLGGVVESLGHLDYSISLDEDGNIKEVLVNGVNFGQDLAAATSFAIARGLREATIGGDLSPEVRSALENSMALTFEELQEELDRAIRFEAGRIGPERLEMRNLIRSYTDDFLEGVRQGLPSAGGLSAIEQNLSAFSREQILGLARSQEEILQERARFFNAELDLELARLDAERAQVEALARLNVARAEVGQTELHAGAALVDGMAGIAGAATGLAGRTLNAAVAVGGSSAAIEAQLRAIDQAQAVLRGLRITADDLAAARANLGGGGGNRRQERADFLDSLEDIERQGFSSARDAVAALNDQLAELSRQGDRFGASEERIAAARQILISETVGDIISGLGSQFFSQDVGGTAGMSEPQQRRAEIDTQFEDARLALEEIAGESAEAAGALFQLERAHRQALQVLAEDVIDGLGLPLEDLQDEVSGLDDSLSFLRDMMEEGIITSDRYADVLAATSDQASSRLGGLAGELLRLAGATEDAAAFEAQVRQAEFHIKRAELQFLLTEYSRLGLLTQEVQEQIQGALDYLDNPDNWPDFSNFTEPTTVAPPDFSQVETAVDDLGDRIAAQIESWTSSVEPADIRRAREAREAFESLRDEALAFHRPIGELTAAFGQFRQSFVDDLLGSLGSGTSTDLSSQYDALQERFDIIRRSLVEIGATASQWEQFAQAQSGALEDFWQNATDPLRDLLADIRGDDPRVGNGDRFESDLQRFQDLAARARAGDLDALQQLEAAGRDLLASNEAFNLGGSRGLAVQDLIASTIEDLLGGLPGGAGGDSPVASAVREGNDVLLQIRDILAGDAYSDASAIVLGAGRTAGIIRAAVDEAAAVEDAPVIGFRPAAASASQRRAAAGAFDDGPQPAGSSSGMSARGSSSSGTTDALLRELIAIQQQQAKDMAAMRRDMARNSRGGGKR